jgi:(p)ppGpp synthase/HD superfamily hydrolase
MAVAGLVGEAGGSENEAIAALLHDAVEDQGGEPILAEIRARFGDEVAGIVDGCSDTDEVPKPPWRPRKDAYIAHLEEADASTCLVSCADKLHNARSIVADLQEGVDVWAKFSGGKDGSLWFYRAVYEVLARRIPDKPVVRLLGRTVEQMERLSR